MKKPLNRKAEVLRCIIETKKKGFTYLQLSKELGNNNIHKYRLWLQEDGLQLTSFVVHTTNRFGREIKYKRFTMKSTRQEALKIYNRINNK